MHPLEPGFFRYLKMWGLQAANSRQQDLPTGGKRRLPAGGHFVRVTAVAEALDPIHEEGGWARDAR